MLAAYTIGLLASLAWIAYLDRHSTREAAFLCALWPVMIPLIVLVVIIDSGLAQIGWCFDIFDSPGGWGTRRPNDGWPGLALRCPWFELHFWKRRNQPRKGDQS